MTDMRKLRKVQRLIKGAAEETGQIEGRQRILLMGALSHAEVVVDRWVAEQVRARRPVRSGRAKDDPSG